MPKLHVVYDPTDQLAVEDKHIPQGAKFATISISKDMEPDNIGEITEQLAELLLEQFGTK